VKQLMHRDRIDEATIRHLLRQAAVPRAAPRVEGLLALVMGSPLPAGHPLCLGYCSTDHKRDRHGSDLKGSGHGARRASLPGRH
jgi:hypothetical protein